MIRIVIDTNVIISALIQQNYPYLIIREVFLSDNIQLCVSSDLMNEYYEVLCRPKFAKFPDFFKKAEAVLVDIETKSIKYNPKIKLNLISDVSDNKVLELADECLADYIITGNINDFTFPIYKLTKIVTPKQFWDFYFISYMPSNEL